MLVTAPVDLVKVRLQTQTQEGGRYRGPVHCAAVILRADGLRGLFRGGFALALRDVPCYGLYFLPYEMTCRALTESGKQPGEWSRSWFRFACRSSLPCSEVMLVWMSMRMLLTVLA